MADLMQEATGTPSARTLATCRALVPMGVDPSPDCFKERSDTKYVTIYKDRNKGSDKRMVIKRTKRMGFSPEMVWKSGQSADFMSKLDKNVKDATVVKFNDDCDVVYWRVNLPPGVKNRDFCVMRCDSIVPLGSRRPARFLADDARLAAGFCARGRRSIRSRRC